jgi:hypothetical protein
VQSDTEECLGKRDDACPFMRERLNVVPILAVVCMANCRHAVSEYNHLRYFHLDVLDARLKSCMHAYTQASKYARTHTHVRSRANTNKTHARANLLVGLHLSTQVAFISTETFTGAHFLLQKAKYRECAHAVRITGCATKFEPSGFSDGYGAAAGLSSNLTADTRQGGKSP